MHTHVFVYSSIPYIHLTRFSSTVTRTHSLAQVTEITLPAVSFVCSSLLFTFLFFPPRFFCWKICETISNDIAFLTIQSSFHFCKKGSCCFWWFLFCLFHAAYGSCCLKSNLFRRISRSSVQRLRPVFFSLLFVSLFLCHCHCLFTHSVALLFRSPFFLRSFSLSVSFFVNFSFLLTCSTYSF